jgi:transitional endoplasmic reticulum ATPase
MGIESDEQLLRAAIAASPENVTARHRLAELLLSHGRCSEALREAQLGLLRAPDHSGLIGVAAMSADLIGAGELAARYGRLLGLAAGVGASDVISLEAADPVAAVGSLRWGRRATDRIGDGVGVDPGERAAALDRLLRNPTDGTGRGHRREQVPMLVRPAVTLRDVAGMTDLKWRLGSLLTEGRGRSNGGVLLFGPAGSGMTFLAEAAAGQHLLAAGSAAMMRLSLPELLAQPSADAERVVLSAFELVATVEPSVLVLEGVDALCDPGRLHGRRIELLHARVTDGLDTLPAAVTVIGTSTAPWRLDEGLRQRGRFARMLFVPPPDLLARSRILADRLSYLPIATDVNAAAIAGVTEGLSATELQMVCARAAEHAMGVSRHVGNVWSITQRDLARAVDDLRPTSGAWFAQAHLSLRDFGRDVDPLFDYVRRHVRIVD